MNILVADDDPVTLNLLESKISAWGHTVYTASDGNIAWEAIHQNPVEIVVSDWVMPEQNGVELCKRIRKSRFDTYIYVILISAHDENRDIVQGLSAGADDYITKPINFDELKARIEIGTRIVKLEHELNQKYDAIEANYYQTIHMFTQVLEVFDKNLGGHSRRVGKLCRKMSRMHPKVSDKDYKIIETAGLLHDIGMIGLPKAILSKKRTEMVGDEQKLYKSHPGQGRDILNEIGFLKPVAGLVGMHHEQFNGKGFPDGLKGDAIPIEAMIVSAASIYDNMLHKGGVTFENIPNALMRIKGYQLSPALIEMLIEINLESEKKESRKTYAEIELDQLKSGMILAKSIRMKTGAFVMAKEAKLSVHGIEKLQSYLKMDAIANTVFIHKHSI